MHIIAATVFLFESHFWAYFFAEHGKHWYEAAVWGNVIAVLPLAVLGAFAAVYHHFAVKELHKQHNEHLRAIVDALDPESETATQLDVILDALDPVSDGGPNKGIKAILDRLK